MKMLWLILVLLGGFIAYRSWNESEQLARTEKARSVESQPGGVVREWQQAPGAVMDMQGALDGGGGSSPKAMLDAARGGLERGRK